MLIISFHLSSSHYISYHLSSSSARRWQLLSWHLQLGCWAQTIRRSQMHRLLDQTWRGGEQLLLWLISDQYKLDLRSTKPVLEWVFAKSSQRENQNGVDRRTTQLKPKHASNLIIISNWRLKRSSKQDYVVSNHLKSTVYLPISKYETAAVKLLVESSLRRIYLHLGEYASTFEDECFSSFHLQSKMSSLIWCFRLPCSPHAQTYPG